MPTLSDGARAARAEYMRSYMKRYRSQMTDEQKRRQAETRKRWRETHRDEIAACTARYWERKAKAAAASSV